jgi:hypothetical protein
MNLESELLLYDIRDGGWQKESAGPVANGFHVLTELVSHERYDFNDQSLVANKLLADALQYALRLRRWSAHLSGGHYVPPLPLGGDYDAVSLEMDDPVSKIRGIGWAAYHSAQGQLAEALHTYDHIDEPGNTDDRTLARGYMRSAARLVLGAEIMANEWDLNVAAAFSDRIAGLRESYGVTPQV